MAEHEKDELEIEGLEAAEIEDEDLEEASGGANNNCGCSFTPEKG